MLVPGKTLPGVYGAASPKENAADLRTKGYELTLSWNDKFNLAGKPFTYGVSFALGDNISKITKYDNPTKDFNVSQYYEGMTIGEIWGYKIDGLFKTDEEAAAYQAEIDHSLIAKNILQTATGKYKGLKAGDPKFVDLDGNGRIDDGEKTANNRGDMRVIGNSRPRYNYRKHQPRLERVRYFGLLSRCRSSAPLPRRQRHALLGWICPSLLFVRARALLGRCLERGQSRRLLP